jgi:predicted ester cyclase
MLMEANETLAVRSAFYRLIIYLQYACCSTEQGTEKLEEFRDGEVRETV